MLKAPASPGGERGASLAAAGERSQLMPGQRAWHCTLRESKVVLALIYRPGTREASLKPEPY